MNCIPGNKEYAEQQMMQGARSTGVCPRHPTYTYKRNKKPRCPICNAAWDQHYPGAGTPGYIISSPVEAAG